MPIQGNGLPGVLSVGATAVVIAVMMILAAIPGLAEAIESWGTAELIETNDGDAGSPQVAMDEEGNAIAVWQQSDGIRHNIWSNRYVVGDGWGDAEFIETNDGDAGSPQVAMDEDGNAIAVWQQSDDTDNSIWSNRYVVGDGWGTATVIEDDNSVEAVNPQVAVDSAGNAIAVWQQSDDTDNSIWSNRYVVGDGWGTATVIEDDNSVEAVNPQVAVDSAGNAIAVWEQFDGIADGIWSNRYVVGDSWGTAEPVATGFGGHNPQVAVDSAGNAIAVWEASDGIVNGIWSNRYAVDDGWGTAELIEFNDAAMACNPQVAVDSAGNAIAVWQQITIGYSIYSNRYVVGDGWEWPQLIETIDTTGYEHACNPQVAVDSAGNAVAVWQQSDGIRHNIWSNRYVVGDGWGDAEFIETNDGDAGSPQVAMDEDGNAIAVWQQSDGTDISIWSNRYSSLVNHYQYRHHTGNPGAAVL